MSNINETAKTTKTVTITLESGRAVALEPAVWTQCEAIIRHQEMLESLLEGADNDGDATMMTEMTEMVEDPTNRLCVPKVDDATFDHLVEILRAEAECMEKEALEEKYRVMLRANREDPNIPQHFKDWRYIEGPKGMDVYTIEKIFQEKTNVYMASLLNTIDFLQCMRIRKKFLAGLLRELKKMTPAQIRRYLWLPPQPREDDLKQLREDFGMDVTYDIFEEEDAKGDPRIVDAPEPSNARIVTA